MVAPEPVRWLIDGNNLMGSRPDGWWRDRRAAAGRLVEQLRRHPWPRGALVSVVFDGPPPRAGAGEGTSDPVPVHVVHAGAHRSADDAIVDAVRDEDAPVIVVTSDRALAGRVRNLGGEVMSTRRLLARLDGGAEAWPQ